LTDQRTQHKGNFESYRRSLFAGETSVYETVKNFLLAAKSDAGLNIFLELYDDSLAQAEIVDRKIKAGNAGKLAGMVIAVKDIIAIKNRKLTCGSRMLENFVSIYDATVIERLIKEDAIVIGKTNLDEFAMGSSTEYSAFGPTLNPVDRTRVPGGSSGGSAAAVAAGHSHAALGSDTGGSVRQPASFCGVVGLKPTYGRVSRYGLVAFASSLDVIGTFSKYIYDSALLLEVIAGHDPRDSTSSLRPVPNYTRLIDREVKSLRVGIAKETYSEGLSDEVRQVIERQLDLFREKGMRVEEINLPHLKYTIATYYILATAEASSNLARYDGARYGHRAEGVNSLNEMYIKSRTEGFGAEVKRRIMLGTFVLSAGYYEAYYKKAQKVRRLIKEDFDRAFAKVDVIVMPTAPTTAFKLGTKTSNPLQMYLSDVYTVSANLAGIPAVSVPVGRDSYGLPVGLQILGRQFDEATILSLANFIEHSVQR
jgi:aspartyl-tRNA(Asn)/glutamyl-tRNA(Gln) amidotransferase subunit A